MKPTFLILALAFSFTACDAGRNRPEVQSGASRSATETETGTTTDETNIQENSDQTETNLGTGSRSQDVQETFDTQEGAGSTPEVFEDETTGDEYSDEVEDTPIENEGY
jgi:hypothetical protein